MVDSDIVVIPNRRKVTSIFVDPHIWIPFKDKCRATGQSTCGILEAFMYGFTKGVPSGPVSPLPAVNVTLHVNRIVRRVRRFTDEREVPEVTSGSMSKCGLCDRLPVVRMGIREPHQLSFRFLCEDHFFESKDSYKNCFWKTLRPFSWRRSK
jgi:hypothetical protein